MDTRQPSNQQHPPQNNDQPPQPSQQAGPAPANPGNSILSGLLNIAQQCKNLIINEFLAGIYEKKYFTKIFYET
jgi:hypothetical protein